MKPLRTGLGLTLALVSSAAMAQTRPQPPTRTVERVAVARVLAPALSAQSVEPLDTVVRDVMAVHDLHRRWIEGRLRAAAAELDGAPVPPAGALPFETVDPVSSIVAPGWMTPARGFSPPMRIAPGCPVRAYARSGLLPMAAEERRRTNFPLVRDIACRFGIPLGLFDALIISESRYDPAVYSPKLAYGFTQLMGDTARELGVDRYDIEGNLSGGARYLRRLLDRFGAYHLALAAYNAGPGKVRNGKVPAISETRTYVSRVLANWSRLERAASQIALPRSRVGVVSSFQSSNAPPRRTP